jgi:hypothetical protein
MYPPNGMTLTWDDRAVGGASMVLKLQCSLYGLKQAGRLWSNVFTRANTNHWLREVQGP